MFRVCCYGERGKGCGFRAEGSRNQSRQTETQGLPATGFLSFNYKDNKCDKWSVTRLGAERKWGKKIGLAPAEEHSTTHVTLQKDVINCLERGNSSYSFANVTYLCVCKVRLRALLQARFLYLCFKPKRDWK